jgi:hypothetical protein
MMTLERSRSGLDQGSQAIVVMVKEVKWSLAMLVAVHMYR